MNMNEPLIAPIRIEAENENHRLRGLVAEAAMARLKAERRAEAAEAALALAQAQVGELDRAARSLLEIGKRDLSNPKYAGYFEDLQAALIKSGVVVEAKAND